MTRILCENFESEMYFVVRLDEDALLDMIMKKSFGLFTTTAMKTISSHHMSQFGFRAYDAPSRRSSAWTSTVSWHIGVYNLLKHYVGA